jgi:hypothetical protein
MAEPTGTGGGWTYAMGASEGFSNTTDSQVDASLINFRSS